MMEATWMGGPWDGRVDALPDGTESVSVAHACWHDQDAEPTPQGALYYVENTCDVMADVSSMRWIIVWREP